MRPMKGRFSAPRPSRWLLRSLLRTRDRCSGKRVYLGYQAITPMMSDSFMIRSSWASSLTSVPDHLPNSTMSPTLRSIGISLPASSRPQGPIAMISPCDGFSLAVSGIMIPPGDFCSAAVPVVRLTEVFQQAAQSQIIVNAHRINQGVVPDLRKPEADSDFYFVEADDAETTVSRIIELVKTRIPRRFGLDPIRDVQVLCPMNRGGVGARSLNIELQAALNPAGDRKVERFGWTFAPGDKVMQIENDYDKEVYNGDIGFVMDVDP